MSSSSESPVQFDRFEDFVAGFIVSLICVIGTLLMGLVVLGSLRIPSMKSSFGILTINQNLAETVACVACFYVFFFGYVLGIEEVIEYSYLIGGITTIMLHIILVSFLLISLNRLCAIAFPIFYKIAFGQKFLIVLLVANWLIPLSYSLYLLVIRQCASVMYHYGWYFSELKNEMCGSRLLIYRAYPQLLLIITTLLADLMTLCLLLLLRNRLFKLKSAEAKKREMNFARQVLVQGVVFLMHGVWYDYGRKMMPGMSENWKIFWTTSFSANLLHVFDPMIVFICNLEFKKWLINIGKTKKIRKIQTVGVFSTSVINSN